APTLTITPKSPLTSFLIVDGETLLNTAKLANATNNVSTATRTVVVHVVNTNATVDDVNSFDSINNSAPTVTGGGATLNKSAAGEVAAANIAVSLNVTDDGTQLASATVTISNVLDAANEFLDATAAGAIVITNNHTASITLTGADSIANY